MQRRFPSFLVKRVPKQENIRKIRALVSDGSIHTVCEEAKCPNIGECFSRQTCTFMILGKICTRSCAFCGVDKGQPSPPDPEEPSKIAKAVQQLGLNYVVITSVTRDDLPDGGARHFSNVINQCQMTNDSARGGCASGAKCQIEVLIPDFNGNKKSLEKVLDARPVVLNHNVETVPRLYSQIRPQANYQQSLEVLKTAKTSGKVVYTKSGFMVGLGEEKAEVAGVLADLKDAGCDIVTIGQYLSPSRGHLPPKRYVAPAEFDEYKLIGEKLGLARVFSGPFVRSSYHAGEIWKKRKDY